MIIGYDRNPALDTDKKIESLAQSVQLALNEIMTEFQKSLDSLTAEEKADVESTRAYADSKSADAVTYEDYDFSVTYSAGTVGTRGYESTEDGSKSGYKPISATVISGNTYYNFFVARVADNGTVTLSAYRATANARTGDAVKVRVAYRKI